MAEGNGVDLGTVVAMLRGVLETQEETRVEMRTGFFEIRAEMKAGLDAVNGRVDGLAKDIRHLRDEVTGIRETLNVVHDAVIGHGILPTEHGERLTALETWRASRSA